MTAMVVQESNNFYLIGAYVGYLLVAIPLTLWVGRTLTRNGAVFLMEAFRGEEELALSVNHLLTVGFYLINIGYVFLNMGSRDLIENLQDMILYVSSTLGISMLVVGAMHFFNLYVLNRIRKSGLLRSAPPPLIAKERTSVAVAPEV